jgi:hypothetical protein
MIKNELYFNAETVIHRTKKATPMGWLKIFTADIKALVNGDLKHPIIRKTEVVAIGYDNDVIEHFDIE